MAVSPFPFAVLQWFSKAKSHLLVKLPAKIVPIGTVLRKNSAFFKIGRHAQPLFVY
jgi:hypothetical protein